MNRNLVFTLGFNLVSEITAATKRLYEQNDKRNFSHTIFDCGFPLLEGDKIPDDIEEAKKQNTEELKILAFFYGSEYVKIENVGVSQNWTAAYNYLKPEDSDNMITCEPDEIEHQDGWVDAIASVLGNNERVGYVATLLVDHIERLKTNRYAHLKIIGGHEIYIMTGNINYGEVGVRGELMNKMGGMGVPNGMPVYGGLETVLMDAIKKYGMQWGILKNFTETHTNVPLLLRQYKDEIIFNINKRGQYSFEKWLHMKRNGEL